MSERRALAEVLKETERKPSDVAGQQIAWLRERKGWTQVDLAERLGEDFGVVVDPATVARIETGKRGLSLDETFLFAAALDAPPSLLMLPLGTGDDVAVTPTTTVHPWLAYCWLTGEGPLTNSDRYAVRLQEQHETRVPLRLYRRLQRLQETVHSAHAGMKATTRVDNEDEWQRQRDRFTEALRDLAEHLEMMDEAGVRPPRMSVEWYDAMDQLGLTYPDPEEGD